MGDSSVASKKKKKGLFKSLGRGLSSKKKKQRPDDESVVSVRVDGGSSTPGPAGRPSLVGGAPPPRKQVSFNDNSTPQNSSRSNNGGSATPASAMAAKPIQVVLLLMDPDSRRFELLQLEFDSNKALVSDVLRQIQSSATETTLRDMTYAGVCDQTGEEMISCMKLSRFCKGNDIVMAMPKGMSGSDTAQLAGPILGDPKVEDMLAPCGVKVKIQPIKKKSSSTSSKLTKISEESPRKDSRPSSPKKSKKASKKKSSSSLPTAVLVTAVSVMLFFTGQRHINVTKPIESGDVLLPGQWKSQCGIFDLFPSEWLTFIPMDKIAPSCKQSSSSMLELGKDGMLRYFTMDGESEDGEVQRKEVWSTAGGNGGQCVEGEEEKDCTDVGATFVKNGAYWYVNIGGLRTPLSKDVVKDFTPEG